MAAQEPGLANIRRNEGLGVQWAEKGLPGTVAAPEGIATARAGRVCVLSTCSPETSYRSRVTPANRNSSAYLSWTALLHAKMWKTADLPSGFFQTRINQPYNNHNSKFNLATVYKSCWKNTHWFWLIFKIWKLMHRFNIFYINRLLMYLNVRDKVLLWLALF